MRLITRADFDGIACAVLITKMEEISEIVFTHPKDMQDGKVDVYEGDIIANIPFHPNAGIWFDHHDQSEEGVANIPDVKGKYGAAPSAARLVYEWYDDPSLNIYDEFIQYADKVDSADLDWQDIMSPTGWVLLSYTIDPRSGIGGFIDYSHLVIEAIRDGKTIDEILEMPAVKGRVDRFLFEQEHYKKELVNHTDILGNVIYTDFRPLEKISTGGRFLVFAIYPQGNVQLRVYRHRDPSITMCAVGKSVLNRTCNVHVGHLMAKYGGGGLAGAGSCPLKTDEAEEKIKEILEVLRANQA